MQTRGIIIDYLTGMRLRWRRGGGWVSADDNRHTRTLLLVLPVPLIYVILYPGQSTTLPGSTTVPPTSTSTPSPTTSPPCEGEQELISWRSRFQRGASYFKILFKFWRPLRVIWTDNMRFLSRINTMLQFHLVKNMIAAEINKIFYLIFLLFSKQRKLVVTPISAAFCGNG